MGESYKRSFWGVVLTILACYGLLNAGFSTRSTSTGLPAHSSEVSPHAFEQVTTAAPLLPRRSSLPPLQQGAVCDTRETQYRKQEMSASRLANVNEVIRERRRELASWQDKSCARWGLSGDRKDRGRRIYYAFSVAYEMDVLKVVLEEIYPVVDVIILQESRHTWGMGFSQEKPLYFRQLHQKHFAKYMDKIRYQEYNFSAVTHCTPEHLGGIPTTVSKECRWHQQWHARNSLELGAHDIQPQDVFVVADLDELLSREFLAALKHCEVHPGMEQPGGQCSKVVALTFGHKYTFDCTSQRPAGHYHPDITLGKCVFFFGPEELRMNYGTDWTQPHKLKYARQYRPQDIRGEAYLEGMRDVERVGAGKHRVVGPVGWHLMSFLSPYQLLYKQYLRSGPAAPDLGNQVFTDGWKDSDIATLRHKMARCDDRADVFRIDAWGCMPLPHLIRDEPDKWRHFIELVPDDEYPDHYGLLTDIRAFLDPRHA